MSEHSSEKKAGRKGSSQRTALCLLGIGDGLRIDCVGLSGMADPGAKARHGSGYSPDSVQYNSGGDGFHR